MKANEFAYTNRQFKSALTETIKRFLSKQALMPTSEPQAFLLGGQSGAGKSLLHKILGERFDENVIIINGDEYRNSHPHFNTIQQRYGVDAPAHTAQWSGAMTKALIDAFSQQKYNLVIEGTLRTSEVPLQTARMLRSRGYAASLAIMAVKPEISLISCQIRYEMMRIAGTTPRAADPQHHNKIIQAIASNLAMLETRGQFDEILLFDRAGTILFPHPDETRKAADVLTEILFGPWSPEEAEHYAYLQSQLEALRRQSSGRALAQGPSLG